VLWLVLLAVLVLVLAVLVIVLGLVLQTKQCSGATGVSGRETRRFADTCTCWVECALVD
jgi:hypothetical protein